MKSILSAMPKKPERTAAVRGALVRSAETATPGFRDLPQDVTAWRWQGYATDPRRLLQREYEKLSWDDIEGFWTDHVKDRPVVLMVVGDPKRVDKKMLEQHGPVTVVREGTLYSP